MGTETHNQAEPVVIDPRGSMLGFWALIGAQFQGALSDNTLKWLVSFLVLESGYRGSSETFCSYWWCRWYLQFPSWYFLFPADIWRTGSANAA